MLKVLGLLVPLQLSFVASSAFFVTGAGFVARLCATGSCLGLVSDGRVRRAGAIELIGLVNRNDDRSTRVYRVLLRELCLYCEGEDWSKGLSSAPFATAHS